MLTRRPATDADKPFLYDALRSAYAEIVCRVYGDWDDVAIRLDFEAKYALGGFEVVEDTGQPIGAIWTTDEGEFLRLREVFILQEAQGRGAGTALVNEEVARTRRAGKPLRLRVIGESRARSLYARLGFAEIGVEGLKVWMEIR